MLMEHGRRGVDVAHGHARGQAPKPRDVTLDTLLFGKKDTDLFMVLCHTCTKIVNNFTLNNAHNTVYTSQ